MQEVKFFLNTWLSIQLHGHTIDHSNLIVDV